jgi:AraC-like DNA-binding protein
LNKRTALPSLANGEGKRKRSNRLFCAARSATLAVATYGRLETHSCGAPVLVIGLYEPFWLTIAEAPAEHCKAAVIPAGIPHRLDGRQRPIACFWLEPSAGSCDLLTAMIVDPCGIRRSGAVRGTAPDLGFFRELYEARDPEIEAWLGEYLARLVARGGKAACDPRISYALDAIGALGEECVPAPEIAARLDLSSSRFQCLFSQVVGVPYRRYRAWSRLRAALAETVRGANLTVAAHAAGFADLAHFSKTYRRAFGSAASAPWGAASASKD